MKLATLILFALSLFGESINPDIRVIHTRANGGDVVVTIRDDGKSAIAYEVIVQHGTDTEIRRTRRLVARDASDESPVVVLVRVPKSEQVDGVTVRPLVSDGTYAQSPYLR
jgi:hypothetical protein